MHSPRAAAFFQFSGGMAFGCCAWILGFCGPKCVDYTDLVPDDLMIDILSRLPQQAVAPCRKVCSRWRMLTSTPRFIELYQRRAKPRILMYRRDLCPELFIYDVDSQKAMKVMVDKALEDYYLVTSCNGLLLLGTNEYTNRVAVLNPSSGEIVHITEAHECCRPCGFYFHPVANDYRILFVRSLENCYEYYVYRLGAKRRRLRRTATPLFHTKPGDFWWPYSSLPTYLNGYLHWYRGGACGIIVFDTIGEELSVQSVPVACRCPKSVPDYPGGEHWGLDLLVKDDCLWLSHVSWYDRMIEVWILENYKRWSWIKKHRIDCRAYMSRFPSETSAVLFGFDSRYVKVISIHNDELTIYWRGKGLFSYRYGSTSMERLRMDRVLGGSSVDHFGYVAYTEGHPTIFGWVTSQ